MWCGDVREGERVCVALCQKKGEGDWKCNPRRADERGPIK